MAATDVLNAVYQFVQAFACATDGDAPLPYADDQIVIGHQNAAVLPPGVTEFCVLSHNSTARHGTTMVMDPADDDDAAVASELVEHIVTVQFYSAEPQTPQYETAARAQMLEMMSRTARAVSFFRERGLSLMYADDVSNAPSWDETKTYTACYTTRLHIEQVLSRRYAEDYFDAVIVRSVDAHTADTRVSCPGYLQTENVDNNH